jgi:hypothetical protein
MMDPNDPTRIQPAAQPPREQPAAWPQPPPSPFGRPEGYDAPPTASYPVASPPAPPYVPPSTGPYGGGPQRPSGPSRSLLITGGVLALLLAGVIGFIVGVQVEKGRKPSTVATGTAASTSTTPTTTGKKAAKGKAARPAAGTGRSTAGLVGATNGNGFTITLPDGSTVNVVVSGSTRIVKTVPGSLADVTTGTRVVVVGPRGQNGDITASMVTIGLARAAGAGGRATTTVP